MVKKTLIIVYNFYFSFWSIKFISILLKVRKNISKIIFILILANKKVFFKNQNFSSLLSIKKEQITMPKVSSLLLSIFYISTLIFSIWQKKFFTKLDYIAITLLPKLIKTLINTDYIK